LNFHVPLPLVWIKNFRTILTGLWSVIVWIWLMFGEIKILALGYTHGGALMKNRVDLTIFLYHLT
jgi:hypothetical protein